MNSPYPLPPPPFTQASALAAATRPKTRTGKVARLPKATRDNISLLIQDGVPYLEILSRLAPESPELQAITEDHLSSWRHGGYQDLLREQQKKTLLHTQPQ